MTSFRAFAARFLPGTRNFNDVAIGDMTDAQLRRSGLNKAEMLHRTFAGLSTNG
ncbi:hypothetical protein RXV86_03850 [Alisedimentitalea sp. MJ-SS2]|uniref:hypothetical protein n=1 Tax=Aliisedimentitalea sp. MJ-SS2 TaxID=3049795 RepID=UPI002911DED5|nr:hypothetical protein [Alisedimentitalea sp. MJ-SS2]MDU8926511.1 hypothetical protein [Alisedimentitalea sp. MJ-SS2]